MALRNVNLNLIPVLQVLLRERSVAAAAIALDLSPAATSEALGRLRALLGDPLLVRVGRAMKLTEKAVALVEPVNRLCEDAESLLYHGDEFVPVSSARHFKIATNDSVVFLLSEKLLSKIRSSAPLIQIHFSEAQVDVFDKLSTREMDLVVMPKVFFDHMAPSQSMKTHMVLRDQIVLAFSAEHPLSKFPTISLEDIAPYPQILYNPQVAMIEGRQEREFMGGIGFNVAARLQQLMLIPEFVAHPPYVAFIPKRVAEAASVRLNLQIRALPFATPSIDVWVGWSPVHQKDPAHLWFRTQLIGVLSQMNRDSKKRAIVGS